MWRAMFHRLDINGVKLLNGSELIILTEVWLTLNFENDVLSFNIQPYMNKVWRTRKDCQELCTSSYLKRLSEVLEKKIFVLHTNLKLEEKSLMINLRLAKRLLK